MDNRQNDAAEQVQQIGRVLRRVWPVVILLVVILIGSSGVYRVESGQAAVITRFGKVLRVEQTAGINFKAPLIDKVDKVSLEQRYKIEYGFRTMASGQYEDILEEQTVIVEAVGNNSSLVLSEMTVEYQVENPIQFLFKVYDPERTIRIILEDTLRNVMQTVSLNDALTDKATIDGLIRPEIQRRISNYEMGVRIIEVKTQNTSLLPDVDTAYREIERANQHRNSRIAEAQKYENTIVPQAEAEAIQLIEDAKGYRASTVAEANAAVAQFRALYTEYQRNPGLVMEKMYTESMRAFLENNRIVIDTTGDGSIYKFYNMEEEALTQAQQAAAAGVGGGDING